MRSSLYRRRIHLNEQWSYILHAREVADIYLGEASLRVKVEDVFLRYLMKKPPLRRIPIFDDIIDVGTALIYGFFL